MTRQSRLLLTTSAFAAALGFSASGALAFDTVNWDWNKTVTETDTINVLIDIDLDPTGLVQVEKTQVNIGDVKAKATVSNINNNTLGDGGDAGVVVIDSTFHFTTSTDDSTDPSTVLDAVGTGGDPLAATLSNGTLDEGSDELNFDINVTGEIPFDQLGVILDAADLPKIENSAVAVANNQSIQSDVPIMLHDGQFNFGGFNDYSDAEEAEVIQGVIGLVAAGLAFDAFSDANIHTAELLAFTAAAAGGIITPGKVEAKAKVSDILNAYVDNSATAVGNNLSASIESETANNHIVMADITQFNYADIKAKAKVEDVNLNGYTGFGEAGLGGVDATPIISNVATAVGNNVSIKVGVPDL